MQLTEFYQFRPATEAAALKEKILEIAELKSLKGGILLADEGINAALSGPSVLCEKVFGQVCHLGGFDRPVVNRTRITEHPFKRLKIKIKKEIVTLRPQAPEVVAKQPVKQVKRLSPEEWNRLIKEEKPILLDVRNDFEFSMGSFADSVNPRTEAFGEILGFINKQLPALQSGKHNSDKLAIFCTGGIRCEKVAPYLPGNSEKEVYLLEGGIVRYLKEVTPDDSLWEGECFVFDDRISVRRQKQ